jgi:hypothetical protein
VLELDVDLPVEAFAVVLGAEAAAQIKETRLTNALPRRRVK